MKAVLCRPRAWQGKRTVLLSELYNANSPYTVRSFSWLLSGTAEWVQIIILDLELTIHVFVISFIEAWNIFSPPGLFSKRTCGLLLNWVACTRELQAHISFFSAVNIFHLVRTLKQNIVFHQSASLRLDSSGFSLVPCWMVIYFKFPAGTVVQVKLRMGKI